MDWTQCLLDSILCYEKGYEDYVSGSEPDSSLIHDPNYLKGWRRAHKNLFNPNPLTFEEIGV